MPLSIHEPLVRDASIPLLQEYSGVADPTWPTFTGASVTKLLGDQVCLNAAAQPSHVSAAFASAFLKAGMLV